MKYYETYYYMKENQLIAFIENDSNGLVPEAVEDLLQVLKDRDIDNEVTKKYIDNIEKYSTENIKKNVFEYMNSTCPICGKNNGINALEIGDVISFIIYTKFKEKIIIGCNDCIKEEIIKSNLYSIFLGLWGIPFGLIGAPLTVFSNIMGFKKMKMKMNEPTKALEKIVINMIKNDME